MSYITKEAYDADIVVRLRNWRGRHLAHCGELFEQAADEIERLRITDAEREAVEWALRLLGGAADSVAYARIETLRGLLEKAQ